MLNALTIDIEDYFQVHAFCNVIKYDDWDCHECRIERNTYRLLEMLDGATQHSTLKTETAPKGTFFVLGWIAERYPHLVREICQQGHEIACHGYAHRLVYSQSREEFREDIRKAKIILENISGCEVIGYRAPSYSITSKSKWAFEVLLEEGFKYDSSIFPIRHDFYGIPSAPRFPFIITMNDNNNAEFSVLNVESNLSNESKIDLDSTFNIQPSKFIIEFPLSTARFIGQNIPIAGGGYFRLFPFHLVKSGLKRINQVEKMPFIFYMHPWEIDNEQPRIQNIARLSKFRHYVNLNKTEKRFKRLLSEFDFVPVKELLRFYHLYL